ncbi:hypothetical protein [Mycobacterium marinum]|uniref:hypothetical protein n=1 Tax=Mycobacterium marinum TaxID=1781 RepID=UPI00115E86E4|nr:hypothetical protein [Mycobacterium marinum]
MRSSTPLATWPNSQRPSAPKREESKSATDIDLAVVRKYLCAIRTACDDLHGAPFNQEARADLADMILNQSEAADAAYARLSATKPVPAKSHSLRAAGQ